MIPFADVSFTTEGMLVIGGLMGALVSALVYCHKLLMQAKAGELAMAKAMADSSAYKEIAMEAVTVAEFRANLDREAAGKPRLRAMAAVVPESSSPVTKEQQNAAELATIRARMAEVKLELGMPPREADEPAPGTSGPDVRLDPSPERLKGDVAGLKQGQIRSDIAKVKAAVDAIPDEVERRIGDKPAEEIKKGEAQ